MSEANDAVTSPVERLVRRKDLEMNSEYIKRDIDDMDRKINALHEVVADLDGIIAVSYIQAIESVIDEWQDATKRQMSGMLEYYEMVEDKN